MVSASIVAFAVPFAGLTRNALEVGERLQLKTRRRLSTRIPTYCCMRPYLNALVKGKDLTAHEAELAMGYAISGKAHDAELAALLSLLTFKGHTAEELSGFRKVFRSKLIPVSLGGGDLLDIVGTGGDGANTVNISTAASVIAAAAGCTVAKHGSNSASSRCGSADVLEELGVDVSISPEKVEKCVRSAGIGFINARVHHPAIAALFPVARAMKIRTVCNIIGPLLNPAGANCMVLGVFSPALLQVMADVLTASSVKKALIVHTDGLDEISNTGITQMIEVDGSESRSVTLDAEIELGMPRALVSDLRGGDAPENANIIRRILAGDMHGPLTDAILLNAGAGCYVYGLDPSIREGVEHARAVLRTGLPLQVLDKWIRISQE